MWRHKDWGKGVAPRHRMGGVASHSGVISPRHSVLHKEVVLKTPLLQLQFNVGAIFAFLTFSQL
jgi:hypothetical protein